MTRTEAEAWAWGLLSLAEPARGSGPCQGVDYAYDLVWSGDYSESVKSNGSEEPHLGSWPRGRLEGRGKAWGRKVRAARVRLGLPHRDPDDCDSEDADLCS